MPAAPDTAGYHHRDSRTFICTQHGFVWQAQGSITLPANFMLVAAMNSWSSNPVRGSYAGYFLHPERKLPGCKFPYGDFKEHWLIGFIYTWNPKADSLHMVSDIEVIVNEKWLIASKSTATGTTFAMSSVRDLRRLKEGKGDFDSPEEFETFWRVKGLNREKGKG